MGRNNACAFFVAVRDDCFDVHGIECCDHSFCGSSLRGGGFGRFGLHVRRLFAPGESFLPRSFMDLVEAEFLLSPFPLPT